MTRAGRDSRGLLGVFTALLLAVSVALPSGPLHADGTPDQARIQQLVARIEARAPNYLPADQVKPGRSALFRDEHADAAGDLAELAAMGDLAVPALAGLLRHPNVHLKVNVLNALAEIGGPAIVPPVLTVVNSGQPAVRYFAAKALGYSASAAALRALNTLAGDDDPTVRNMAIQTDSVLRDILNAEQEPTSDERITALLRLAYAPEAQQRLVSYGETAVPLLLATVRREGEAASDEGAVVGAALALAQIGVPDGLAALWEQFQASVQAEAPQTKFAWAIAEYRNAEVWPYLLRLLESEVAAAQYYALERLRELDHPDRLSTVTGYVQRQIEAGKHKETTWGEAIYIEPLAVAIGLLGDFGTTEQVPLLEQLIAESPPAERSIVKPLAQQALAAVQERMPGTTAGAPADAAADEAGN